MSNRLAQDRWARKQVALGRCRCGNERLDVLHKSCERCIQKAKAWSLSHRELVLARKRKNRPRTNELRKIRTEKQKDICYSAYGGYSCVCCQEAEKLFLDLDHINNDGANHRKNMKWSGSEGLYRWIIKNSFPPIFQVLCRNCNWGKYRNNGVCPHQTVNAVGA